MKTDKQQKWPVIRNLFRQIHLWTGIGSSLILFLVCLSGTVYTFKDEIQQMIEPERYRVEVEAGTTKLPLAEIISRVESTTGGKVTNVTVPGSPEQVYTLNVRSKDEQGRGTNYPVNPYTGEITAEGKAKGDTFFMVMFRLHRWLLLDTNVGRPIVGVATIIFVLLIISGWVIWIPRRIRMWKEGLKVRATNSLRLNLDLHRTLGFYASLVMLVMALTGLYWSFEWYRDGMFKVLNVERPAARPAGVQGGNDQGIRREAVTENTDDNVATIPMLAYEKYLEETDRELPYQGIYRLNVPAEKENEVSVTKVKTGFFASSSGDRVVLDKASGSVKKVEKFGDQPLNAQIMRSVKAIHTGTIFGTFSKIIYFLACLIATTLPVTGIIIWINKLRFNSAKDKFRNFRMIVP